MKNELKKVEIIQKLGNTLMEWKTAAQQDITELGCFCLATHFGYLNLKKLPLYIDIRTAVVCHLQ